MHSEHLALQSGELREHVWKWQGNMFLYNDAMAFLGIMFPM